MLAPVPHQPLRLRPALPRDLDEIVELDRQAFEHLWSFDEFADALQDAQRHVYVHASQDATIEGYIVWDADRSRVLIENLAVRADQQRRHLATRMIEFVCAKHAAEKPIFTLIRETNLAAQLLFRGVGFHCHAIQRERYPDSPGELALGFRLRPTRALELGLAHPIEVRHAA